MRGNENYRFGFNGKESDDEIKGNGNSLDFGARIYDSRLGRWLSPDPLESKYPDYSTYNAFLNNPILVIDPTGKGGKSSLVEINGQKTIVVTATLIVFTNNHEIQDNIHNHALTIEREIESYYNTGSVSSWGGAGEYPVVFNVTVEIYQEGQPINTGLDVNYVELTNDNVSEVQPDNVRFNVSGSRTEGSYAHEFGHILGFGYLRQMTDDLSDGVMHFDHPFMPAAGSNVSDEEGLIPDNRVMGTRMGSGSNRMNQNVIDQLNYGAGVGNPLDLGGIPNDKVLDISEEQYGQHVIQGNPTTNGVTGTTSFNFGQKNTFNPSTNNEDGN